MTKETCKGCIAYVDGECVTPSCRGNLSLICHNPRKYDRESARKMYEIAACIFDEKFNELPENRILHVEHGGKH